MGDTKRKVDFIIDDGDDRFYESHHYNKAKEHFDNDTISCAITNMLGYKKDMKECVECGRFTVADRHISEINVCVQCVDTVRDRIMTWAIGRNWREIPPVRCIPMLNDRLGVIITPNDDMWSGLSKIKQHYDKNSK